MAKLCVQTIHAISRHTHTFSEQDHAKLTKGFDDVTRHTRLQTSIPTLMNDHTLLPLTAAAGIEGPRCITDFLAGLFQPSGRNAITSGGSASTGGLSLMDIMSRAGGSATGGGAYAGASSTGGGDGEGGGGSDEPTNTKPVLNKRRKEVPNLPRRVLKHLAERREFPLEEIQKILQSNDFPIVPTTASGQDDEEGSSARFPLLWECFKRNIIAVLGTKAGVSSDWKAAVTRLNFQSIGQSFQPMFDDVTSRLSALNELTQLYDEQREQLKKIATGERELFELKAKKEQPPAKKSSYFSTPLKKPDLSEHELEQLETELLRDMEEARQKLLEAEEKCVVHSLQTTFA